jgi:hypothetical protein
MSRAGSSRFCAGALLSILTPFVYAPAWAEDWQSPNSPFTLGEAQPAQDASCETAGYWMERAPQVEGRVSFAITGTLAAVHWDGALGYLIMCAETGVQVMCVTYGVEGRAVGQTVTFAGGYGRAGDRRILLDPCLASAE